VRDAGTYGRQTNSLLTDLEIILQKATPGVGHNEHSVRLCRARALTAFTVEDLADSSYTVPDRSRECSLGT